MALVTISLFTFFILIVGSSLISQVFGDENTKWTIGESQWEDYQVSDNEPARIIVVDHDQNTSPSKTDYIRIHIFSDTDAAGISMQLKESPTPDSGKFIGDVYFTGTSKSEGDTLRITTDDTVYAVYSDKTLPRPYDVGDILNIYSTAYVKSAEEFFPGMAIELDQKVYTWTDKVYFTVVSFDHNKDPYQRDVIGDSAGELVEISTKFGKLSGYNIIETGENTSIFTGEVTLTGDPFHDADGDGFLNGATGKTSGSGPSDGFIKSTSDDGISIAVQINEDKFWYGDALIRWNVGELQFINRDIPNLKNLIIRAVDPDMNLNPELVDTIDVKVSSDSDKKGTTITLSETSYATGVFEGIVFPTTGNSGGKYIHASKGEYVYAYYDDHTLPSPYTPADYLSISGSQKVTNVVSSQIEPKPNPIPSQPVVSPPPVKTNTLTPKPVAPTQSPTQTISAASSLPSNNDSAPSIKNKIHTISAFGTSSDDVPVLGEIRVDLNFDMDFEVQTPTLISAGKSAEIVISPKTGTLTTTFYLNGNYIHALSRNVNFGHVEQIVVPTAELTVINVLEFFVTPSATFYPKITGPASISSNNLDMQSMNSKTLQVSVSNDIQNWNAIVMEIPVVLNVGLEGNINLLVANFDLFDEVIPVTTKMIISETIPVDKHYNTNLSLQVLDGSRHGYVKIKPSLTYDSDRSLSNGGVKILVDGVYHTTLSANQWSGDVKTGSGQHNFQAIYDGNRDSTNKAIFYQGSTSDIKVVDVKSPPLVPKPKSDTQDKQMLAQAQTPQLSCGIGTHQENNVCVADANPAMDAFSSVFANIEGFFKSLFGN